MKKKILTMLLCISMTMTLLSGCGGKSIALFSGDEANFIIVRSADADSETTKIAGNLRQTIADSLGVTVNYKPDTIQHTDGQLEINVGITNRPDSQAVYDEVANETETNGLDYIIKQTGDYIYIIGMSTQALQNGVDYFAKEFLSTVKSSMDGNYRYVYAHSGNTEHPFTINGNADISKYKIVTPKYNMSYLVGREVEILNNSLMETNGLRLQEATDWEEETGYEILIDDTKRSEEFKPLDSDQYRIKVNQNKVYIIGGSDEATAVAVKEFQKMVLSGEGIDEKTDIIGSYAETVKAYENYYSLTFQDEFDTIDTSVWTYVNGITNNGNNPNDTRTVILRMIRNGIGSRMENYT